MTRLSSVWLCNGLIASALAFVGLSTVSCSNEKNTQFMGANTFPTPFGAKSLGSEMVACSDPYRPVRVAFVVDNTRSNSETPGKVQSGANLNGSDPIKQFSDDKYLLKDEDLAGLNTEGLYTHRQYAVYKAIRKLQKAALEARTANPNFAGIDIGLSHFPRTPSEPNSVPTEQDMSEPVFYSGGNTGLPEKMNDVSKIPTSGEFNQKIWDTLKFTHLPNGMTPYVTAFKAAKTLLNQEKKPDDKRSGVMILVTDGLPSDRVPSQIIEARKELGKDNRVVLLQLYGFGEINDEKQNEAPKKKLSEMFSNEFKWGQEEHPNFESYWKALLAIPNSPQVRDDQIQVKSNQLNKGLDDMLKYIITCGGNKK